MSNTAEFIIKAKNATDPAFAAAERNLKAFSASASAVTAMLGGATATAMSFAGAAAFAVTNLAQQGRELEQQAQKAGVSVEQMQALDYATRQYNITGEQFADMVKDAREKVGDFVATGGGEMKDFFEKIAPKVGVTAEQLQHLSGPEVLIAVKKALDDANLSAKEQTFYLESLANDASTLAPLLAKDAAQLRALTEEFNGLNTTLTQTDITNLKEMDKKLDDVGRQLSASFAFAVVGAGEQIDWLTEKLSLAVRNWGIMFDSWADNPRTEQGIARAIAKVNDLRQPLEQLISDYDRLNQKRQLDPSSLSWGEELFLLDNDPAIKASRKQLDVLRERHNELQQLRHALEQSSSGPPLPPSGGGSGSAPGGHDADQGVWWERLDQEKEYQAASLKGWQTYYGGMEEYYRSQMTAAERGVDWSGVNNDANWDDYSAYGDASLFADSLVQETRTLEDELENRRELLEEYYELDLLNHEQYTAAKQALDTQAEDYRNQMQAAELQRASLLFGGLSDLTGVFAGEQSAAYKALFAFEKGYHIASVLMSSADAIGKAWASAPFPYNLPAVGAATVETGALSAMVQGVQLGGMAHNGIEWVPAEGTWLLDKGERVYTNDSARRIDQMYERVMGPEELPLEHQLPVMTAPAASSHAAAPSQYNVTIQAIDTQSGIDFLTKNRTTIFQNHQREARNQGAKSNG